MVEQDQEGQSLYQRCQRAADELKKSAAEINNSPERTQEDKERLGALREEELIDESMKPIR
jgi:hypothetical protein